MIIIFILIALYLHHICITDSAEMCKNVQKYTKLCKCANNS